jgi:hypothetical protein
MTGCPTAPQLKAKDADGPEVVGLGQMQHPKPKIIFIAGASHSGSTLLDLMLNAHPEIASVGELKQLGRYARFARKRGRTPECTCRAPSLEECPFWASVGALTQVATGQSLGELNVEDYDNPGSFARDNVVLFDAISTAANKRYIVDSSKTSDRLERLLANPELDVFPIFLVRDPKGQICSLLRKNEINSGLEKNTYGLIRLIGNYVATNRRIYRLVRHRPHAVVHYEELAWNPEQTLAALMQQLDLAFHPRQLEWASQERHNISGNRMRFSASSELKLDEHWRDQLTFVQKLAVDAGTLPGRAPLLRFGWC